MSKDRKAAFNAITGAETFDSDVTNPQESNDEFGDSSLTRKEDPVTRALEEDPILKAISKSWRQIVIIVIAAFALSYAWNQVKETRRASKGESTQQYLRIASALQALESDKQELASLQKQKDAAGQTPEQVAETSKKLEDLQKKTLTAKTGLSESLLALADSNEPYSKLVPLYQALLAQGDGHYAKSKEILSGTVAKAPVAKEEASFDIFNRELSSLALATSLLDNPETFKQGNDVLTKLAKESEYLRVPAMLSLSRLAKTKAEQESVLDMMTAFADEHPEQKKFLEREISAKGGK